MGLLDDARNKKGSSEATAWKPDTAGDGVEGVVTEISHRESDFQAGVMVPFVTLLTDKGDKVSVAGFRTVLRKEIEQEKPSIGDRMAAVYMGTEKLKTGKFAGKDVHVYRVVVDHKNGKSAASQPAASSAASNLTDEPPF